MLDSQLVADEILDKTIVKHYNMTVSSKMTLTLTYLTLFCLYLKDLWYIEIVYKFQ